MGSLRMCALIMGLSGNDYDASSKNTDMKATPPWHKGWLRQRLIEPLLASFAAV
jgi:hypothetical protein